jgi:hypothetical protein
MTQGSLQKRLDAGKPPAWLQPLSPPEAPLQAYRVAPKLAVAQPGDAKLGADKPPRRGRT